MGDRDDRPSLELPSLGGWRRRRREKEAVAPAEPVADAPPPAHEPAPVRTEQPTAVLPEPEPETETVAEAPSGARRIEVRARRAGGPIIVVVVGLLVGLAVVGLTWASLRTCEEVQGTTSCGRAGYPMLALVLVLAVLVGVALLRLARVPDPVSTTVLGVGLACVIALLFLVDSLDEPAMVVVIPVISAVTFALSHWVTTTFVEPGDR
ncbi:MULTISPECIES: hypothetical protein [unclassified Nocardioides]|uniref:hypothetical protein n=1 Tax=unclassified Nocardioides TaxID=2615069 RepID=UPI0036195BB6